MTVSAARTRYVKYLGLAVLAAAALAGCANDDQQETDTASLSVAADKNATNETATTLTQRDYDNLAKEVLLDMVAGVFVTEDNFAELGERAGGALGSAGNNPHDCWHLFSLAAIIDDQIALYPDTRLASKRSELPITESDLADCPHQPGEEAPSDPSFSITPNTTTTLQPVVPDINEPVCDEIINELGDCAYTPTDLDFSN